MRQRTNGEHQGGNMPGTGDHTSFRRSHLRHPRSYCVTLYVGGIRFYQPVLIGTLVEVHAKIIYTGTTSMHLAVDVRSRDSRMGSRVKTTSLRHYFCSHRRCRQTDPSTQVDTRQRRGYRAGTICQEADGTPARG